MSKKVSRWVRSITLLSQSVRLSFKLASKRISLYYDQNLSLAKQVQERTAQLEKTRLEVIQRLGRAAEYKDNETGMHVIRMSHYSKILAEQLDVSKRWVELVFQASPMHDIGKIGIPDAVLRKPGKVGR